MTGTGTAEDPFCPENFDEFITAIETSGVYVSCPENGLWNMNKIRRDGITEDIEVKCYGIDGNNCEIRNLFTRGDSTQPVFKFTGRTCYVDSLHFVSFLHNRSNSLFRFDYVHVGEYTFYNCKFSGVMARGSLFSTGSAKLYFKSGEKNGCSFDIRFLSSSVFFNDINSTPFYDCNIRFSGKSSGTGTRIRLINSKLQGELPFPKMALSKKSETSLVDMRISSDQAIEEYSTGSTIESVLINTDKTADGAEIPQSLIKVPQSKLTDAEYLNSVGFPIGGV